MSSENCRNYCNQLKTGGKVAREPNWEIKNLRVIEASGEMAGVVMWQRWHVPQIAGASVAQMWLLAHLSVSDN